MVRWRDNEANQSICLDVQNYFVCFPPGGPISDIKAALPDFFEGSRTLAPAAFVLSLTALLVIDQRRLIKRVIERNGRQRWGLVGVAWRKAGALN
jgi:hypothetical protein